MIRRRFGLLLLAALLASGLFFRYHWHANAAAQASMDSLSKQADEDRARLPPGYGSRASSRRAPGPAIEPYVRPEFAAEMRGLRPAILAAARRHNDAKLSGMSDEEFAVVIALIMYNEHFGWFEERVTPVQVFTPFYEDLQRETNAAGIADLSIWPANIRPSVAIEILSRQVPLPRSTSVITVPITVAGSQINLASYHSQSMLYAAITKEIAEPQLAVEYLAANLERGLYRAQIEQVPVTWRALAAWHNQGIVSPRDIRDNPTASSYVQRASAYLGKAHALIDQPPHSLRLARHRGA